MHVRHNSAHCFDRVAACDSALRLPEARWQSIPGCGCSAGGADCFFEVLHHEVLKAYSFSTFWRVAPFEAALGPRSTACIDIEFMIRQGIGGRTVTAFRVDEKTPVDRC